MCLSMDELFCKMYFYWADILVILSLYNSGLKEKLGSYIVHQEKLKSRIIIYWHRALYDIVSRVALAPPS